MYNKKFPTSTHGVHQAATAWSLSDQLNCKWSSTQDRELHSFLSFSRLGSFHTEGGISSLTPTRCFVLSIAIGIPTAYDPRLWYRPQSVTVVIGFVCLSLFGWSVTVTTTPSPRKKKWKRPALFHFFPKLIRDVQALYMKNRINNSDKYTSAFVSNLAH